MPPRLLEEKYIFQSAFTLSWSSKTNFHYSSHSLLPQIGQSTSFVHEETEYQNI